jgi:hypothetical protein
MADFYNFEFDRVSIPMLAPTAPPAPMAHPTIDGQDVYVQTPAVKFCDLSENMLHCVTYDSWHKFAQKERKSLYQLAEQHFR